MAAEVDSTGLLVVDPLNCVIEARVIQYFRSSHFGQVVWWATRGDRVGPPDGSFTILRNFEKGGPFKSLAEAETKFPSAAKQRKPSARKLRVVGG